MAEGHIWLSRKQLHDLLWEEPIPNLATRLNVKPWRIWQAAKDYDLAGPTSGTWTLRRDRLPMPPPRPLEGNPETLLKLVVGSARGSRETAESTRTGPEWHVTVDSERPPTHRLVKALSVDLKRKQGETGKGLARFDYAARPKGNPLYGLERKPEVMKRVLAILDALLIALEKRGYKVAAGDGGTGTFTVTISRVSIGFWIRERLKPNPRDPRDFLHREPAFRGTGKLTLMMRMPYGYPDTRHLDPTPERPGRMLHERLNDVISRLEGIAETAIVKEREAEKAAAEAAEREKIRQQREAIRQRNASYQRAHRERVDHYHRLLRIAIRRFHRAHAAEFLRAELAGLELNDKAAHRFQKWAATAIDYRHSKRAIAESLLDALCEPRRK